MVWSVGSDYFMAGYSSKVHSDGKAWYYFHRYTPAPLPATPPPPLSPSLPALSLCLPRARAGTHAPHTRAESPSGSSCMNYRLLMWGYEMPSAQEAAHSLAGLLESASSLKIKKDKKIIIIKYNLNNKEFACDVVHTMLICLSERGQTDNQVKLQIEQIEQTPSVAVHSPRLLHHPVNIGK